MLQAARARIIPAQRKSDRIRVKDLFVIKMSLLQSKSKGLYNKKSDKSRKRDRAFEINKEPIAENGALC